MLRIAVPNKGSLSEPATTLLREADRHPDGRATAQMHDVLQQLGLTQLLPK